jgi:hypothetical protein
MFIIFQLKDKILDFLTQLFLYLKINLPILLENPQNISKAKIINPTNFFTIFPRRTLKVVVSPHYDDLAFSLGGTITSFSRYNMEIDDLIVFSRTTYTKDNPGHSGGSKIEKNVSTQRLLEEKNMTNLLKNIKISLLFFFPLQAEGFF